MFTLAQKIMVAGSRYGTVNYFTALAGAGTTDDSAVDAAVGLDGSLYLLGYSYTTPRVATLAKFAPLTGALVWQRKISAAVDVYGVKLSAKSAGAVYVLARENQSTQQAVLLKYSDAGVLQWQRSVVVGTATISQALGGDAAGNVYLGAYSYVGTDYAGHLAKYNAAGALQWQRKVSANSTLAAQGVHISEAGDVYLLGRWYEPGAGANRATVYKYNAAGTLQWQRYLSLATYSNDYFSSLAIGGDGSLYLGGQTYTSAQVACVMALDASGAHLWHRYFTGVSTQFDAIGLAPDGHVVAMSPGVVAKLNATTGALIWQRAITGGSLRGGRLSGDTLVLGSDVAISGHGTDMALARLPTSGGGLKSYGGVIPWVESTYATNNDLTPATGTATVTEEAGDLTDAAGALTDAAGDLTHTLYL